LLCEVRLVVHQGVYSFDELIIALRHLLDVAAAVIPWFTLHVEDFKELELDEVVVCIRILSCESVGYERLDISLLLIDCLYSVVSHRF
jgi:hypothetical protein